MMTVKAFTKIMKLKGYTPIIQSQSIVIGKRSSLKYTVTFKENKQLVCKMSPRTFKMLKQEG